MSKLSVVIFFFLFLMLFSHPASADEYILSYPSYMPGNVFYPIRRLWERIEEAWYFGHMTQVRYHLKTADKYLVEAKTLFEYGQYKLAVDALSESNNHFIKAVLYELDVTAEKKDNGTQKKILVMASEKHKEILSALGNQLPQSVIWNEERKEPVELKLFLLFKEAEIARSYALK